MKKSLLENFITEVIKEQFFSLNNSEYENGEKDEGWFSKFIGFFKKDKGLAEEAANYFFDDFEEKTLIELPEDFKDKVLIFCEKKFPFAMKKAKGDEKRAVRLMSRVLSHTFSHELRRIRNEYIDDDDYDLV